jgi:hypothetical protein
VTINTERDQIFFGVIAQQTPRLNMVNLQVSHAAALLAAPAISL